MNHIKENPADLDFPTTFYIQEDDELETITVTEEAWNKTAQITNQNTSHKAAIKMLKKQI